MRTSCVLSMVGILATNFLLANEGSVESQTQLAIRKMELLGGKVTRNEKLPQRPVIEIDLEGSKRLTNGHLHLLLTFDQLTVLNLRKTRITDEGAVSIVKLTHLSKLNLADTAITDEGLKEISNSESLTTLILNDTQVTDFGLLKLSQLKNLQSVLLLRTAITDSGEAEIVKLRPGLRIRRVANSANQEFKGVDKHEVLRALFVKAALK